MAKPVIGADELRAAFIRAGTSLDRDMRERIAGYAEPVREQAETLAQLRIRNIGVPWSRMRKGTVTRLVYVAPVERGVRVRGDARKRRPRFADILMGRAMEPALEANRPRIEQQIQELIARMERKFGGA